MESQIARNPQKLRETRKNPSSHRAWPGQHLDFRLLTSGPWDNKFLLLYAAQFVVLWDDSPRKRTQQRKTAKVHHQQMYMGMLRLPSGAETWEGFTYSSTGTWINKLWYHKKTEAVKRKTLQQHATTRMNLGSKHSASRVSFTDVVSMAHLLQR